MADPLPRLVAALADRYRLERELGQGGMATVYLAHDLKHDREVALKLLRPELGAVLGAVYLLAVLPVTAFFSQYSTVGHHAFEAGFVVLVVLEIGLGAGTWVVKYGWPSWLSDFRFAANFTIAAESRAISIKAQPGWRRPKKIGVHAAFSTSCAR